MKTNKHLTYHWVIIGLFTLLLIGCQKKSDKLDLAFQIAGNNAVELKKVLSYYQNDSIKLDAAMYLIENMIGKYSLDHKIRYRNEIYSADDFVNLFKDSVCSLLPNIEFVTEDPTIDLEVLDSETLIKNIDLAFEAKDRYWWCNQLEESTFYETILPYRAFNEPNDGWREFYYAKYKGMADSIAQLTNSMDSVVSFFNRIMRRNFIKGADGFNGCMYTSEINAFDGGTCLHLAVDAAHAMRAIGLPINLDIMPFHGKINGGHVYNSYKKRDGSLVFFSPYDRPKERNSWTAPLILRSVFSNDHNFYENGLVEVTDDYYDNYVDTISAEEKSIVKLAVFNRGKFSFLNHLSNVKDKYVFKIVPGIMYFPFSSKNDITTPYESPFFFNQEGVKCEIEQKTCSPKTIIVNLTDGTKIIQPHVNRRYNLMVWSETGWKSVAHTIATENRELVFNNVGVDGLFVVLGQSNIEIMQRPFIENNGNIKYF